MRAVRLYDAIYGQGLSVQMAFERFDLDNNGILSPMEFCRALHDLGFSFAPEEVVDWLEAIDAEKHHTTFPDFLAFVKSQVVAFAAGQSWKAREVVGPPPCPPVLARAVSAPVPTALVLRRPASDPVRANTVGIRIIEPSLL